MRSLFTVILFSMISNANAYYYYLNYKPNNDQKPRARYAYPIPKNEDTTFGANIASGFSMTYPKSYIHILSHCFGLSTNLQKLVLRGLQIEDKNTKRRLRCYVTGLSKSLEDFSYDGKTSMEIAEESNNQTAIDYMLSL
jgi:hypothetical protein